MNNRFTRLLQSNDDGDIYGSGPSAAVASPPVSTPVLPPPSTPATPATSEPAAAAATPAPVAAAPAPLRVELSPEALREIRGMHQQGARQPEPPTAAQLADQRAKLMQDTNFFQLSKENLQKMGVAEPTDEQVQHYQEMVSKTAAHGFGMGKYYTDQVLARQQKMFEEQLAPVREFITQRQSEQVQSEFHGKYPALKEFPSIIDSVAKTISPIDAQGRQRSKDDLFKEVAEGALAVIRQARGDPNLTFENFPVANAAGNTQQAGATPSAVPRPNQMTGTGRSAGGTGGSQTPGEYDIYKSEWN